VREKAFTDGHDIRMWGCPTHAYGTSIICTSSVISVINAGSNGKAVDITRPAWRVKSP